MIHVMLKVGQISYWLTHQQAEASQHLFQCQHLKEVQRKSAGVFHFGKTGTSQGLSDAGLNAIRCEESMKLCQAYSNKFACAT